MIERQAVGDAAAAIVAGDGEALKSQPLHHRHHVRGQRPLGIGCVILVEAGQPLCP